MKQPSVVLCGAKPGAAVALTVLLERHWDVRYVVVTPDQGSSDWSPGPTLKDIAAVAGIPAVTQEELPREPVDFVLSYMYRRLVKADVLALAVRAALNFHAAPLPEYGGWAFYNVAILEGATEYGCTCHYMDTNFDTGPLLEVRRFPIDPTIETAASLERKAQAEMIGLFVDFCLLAESGAPLPRVEQERLRMRYLTRTEFNALKVVPPVADALTVDRYARAFWYPPYRCATIDCGGVSIEIVPEVAKLEIAAALHRDDFQTLLRVAQSRSS